MRRIYEFVKVQLQKLGNTHKNNKEWAEKTT